MSYALQQTPSERLRKESELYEYQREARGRITFRRQQAVLLKPGLGKTVITLSALRDLQVRQTIVFAPAQVVEMDVWGREASRWEHLASTRVFPVAGTQRQRLDIIRQTANVKNCVLVLSYNNLVWFTQFFKGIENRFGAVVFDELSRMKSPGTKWFRAARTWLSKIPIRIGLTGTPVGNHLLDIWGEMYSVGGPHVLGPTFTQFKNKFFYPTDFHRWKWLPLPGTQETIQTQIKPWAFSIQPSAGPRQPLVKVNEVEVNVPDKVQQMAKVFARQLRVELESKEELLACSTTVVAQKLRQFASGAVIHDTVSGKWEWLHDEKLRAVEELLEEQQGDPVLLFYHYQHERERILKRFSQAHALDTREDMESWNRGDIELAVAHPQSTGFGLNLQDGGSTICWYTLPWSCELWEQATARLARQGQKAAYVTSHVLLAGQVDRMVLSALRNKGRVQQEVLDELAI